MPCAGPSLLPGLPGTPRYCCTIALPASVTAVCASSLPFAEAPVFIVIDVCDKTTPCICAVVPMSTMPATCQKTFFASAPPVRKTFALGASVILYFATESTETSESSAAAAREER